MTAQFPELLLDSVENAVSELVQFYADGGRAMVDSMPAGGRNVAKLAEISGRAGVHLVCPSGPRLPHRAGIIKVAGEGSRIDPTREQTIFLAAAVAHPHTGCPSLTHTEAGRGARAQVDQLAFHGVDPAHVVLSHTDRQPDVAADRELLRTGVNVEFDSAFRWHHRPGNPTLDLLHALYDEFSARLLPGMDAARPLCWRSCGGTPGLSCLLTDSSRHLTPEMFRRIFITNPARVYAFSTPSHR